MRTIALFDLDGTITRKDTMLAFLRMERGRAGLVVLLARILPQLVGERLGLLPADTAKKALVKRAFGGRPVAALEESAARFQVEMMPGLLRPAAMQRIAQYKKDGDRVVIVTASCSLWVEAWCRQQGLELIATELEKAGSCFTGRLATPNCRGAEKVRRIHAALGDLTGRDVHAYGDTASDKHMLGMARLGHYRPFR